ncbi:ABC transporter ATP-binding protein [Aquibacillus sp. 3ASR75-11]|uniref:ABC transporter ATP-binding protein n=1 Tax=Terrihalobacillus insolitus TaxID=2950438 RepID=A0A9X3WUH9_9BACI|nr:ABC transporter ATP-binding protein [Terrihalobacillus insolitus]MDC3424476.1 ABC transporter ATP-binding protein [Terrihalobacillus insolitus]
MIVAKELCKRYGSRDILMNINLSVQRGEVLGVIGPNGCGKSTLMKLLSGAEKPTKGTVEINGKFIKSYKQRELAQTLAVLPQEAIPEIGFTVREIIEMGRYPFQNWLGEETKNTFQEESIVDQTIEILALKHIVNQTIENISGGERQRVALGKVMAQDPTVLMLDEPTTYLDIGHQLQMMEAVKRWQQDKELTVVVILHDLNIASMYCDRLVLMQDGKIQTIGEPAEVIKEETIASVYDTEPIVIDHPRRTVSPQIILDPQ